MEETKINGFYNLRGKIRMIDNLVRNDRVQKLGENAESSESFLFPRGRKDSTKLTWRDN